MVKGGPFFRSKFGTARNSGLVISRNHIKQQVMDRVNTKLPPRRCQSGDRGSYFESIAHTRPGVKELS